MVENSKNTFAEKHLPEEPTIYLAGPDVFYPNAVRIGQINKLICAINKSKGLFPLDNVVDTSLPKSKQAEQIVYGNINLINESDIVLANLSNFRGTKEHPCCDSGTAWECGYGIARGKIVIGYTYTPGSVPQEIINNIHLLFNLGENGDLFSVFTMMSVLGIRSVEANPLPYLKWAYSLDPIYEDVLDANPITSFYLGMKKGLAQNCMATLTDKRSMNEKYGMYDKNGNSVENFNYPVNIMIAVTTTIQ